MRRAAGAKHPKHVGWGFYPNGFFEKNEKLSFNIQYLHKTKPFGPFLDRQIPALFGTALSPLPPAPCL